MESGQSPNRSSRLKVIVVTALISFFVTLGGTWVIFLIESRREPPTPRLEPPRRIQSSCTRGVLPGEGVRPLRYRRASSTPSWD